MIKRKRHQSHTKKETSNFLQESSLCPLTIRVCADTAAVLRVSAPVATAAPSVERPLEKRDERASTSTGRAASPRDPYLGNVFFFFSKKTKKKDTVTYNFM